MIFGAQKTRMATNGEKNLKICLFVLTQYTNVTDTQSHRNRMTANTAPA